MRLKKLHIIIVIAFLSVWQSKAQEASYYLQAEDSILKLMPLVLGAPTELERKQYADSVFNYLHEVLSTENSFYYPFDRLKKRIAIATANDRLRIFTFTTTTAKDKHIYYGIVQWYNPKLKSYQLITLNDNQKLQTGDVNKVFSNKKWYGALYYKVLHLPKMPKNKFVLLGWDGNDVLTNKKIIDVITISGNGNIKFGAPDLKNEQGRTIKRMIFEYSDEVVMSLKYEPDYSAIVFDYLVPISDQFEGVYAYYGPSVNRFDALIYHKGKWSYKKDLNITLNKTSKDKLYKDPKE